MRSLGDDVGQRRWEVDSARLFPQRAWNKTRPSRSLLVSMHSTISQILYPNRQAFFEKLALSLPPQPAIKIGPAPLPSGERRPGLRNLRRAVPAESLSKAQRSMGKSRSISSKPATRRDESDKLRLMRTPLSTVILKVLAWFAYPALFALVKSARCIEKQRCRWRLPALRP